MKRGKLNGTSWNIEKGKGYNTTYRKCFNCYYFDDNCCNKKNIPLSTNNARYCNDYIRGFEEINKSTFNSYQVEMEASEFINNYKRKRIIKKVEYGDSVKLYDEFFERYIILNVEKSTENKIKKKFIHKLMYKEEGTSINFRNKIYQIESVLKKKFQDEDENIWKEFEDNHNSVKNESGNNKIEEYYDNKERIIQRRKGFDINKLTNLEKNELRKKINLKIGIYQEQIEKLEKLLYSKKYSTFDTEYYKIKERIIMYKRRISKLYEKKFELKRKKN